MIPDEAVEAAWATIWDANGEPTCNIIRREMRAALEAAAPHMLEQAWDECNNSDTPWINPYRSQA